jgi:glycosyltransferase involved in cell wall biosynthesis
MARALASSGQHQIQVVSYGDADGVDEQDGYPVERIGRGRDVLTRYWNYFVAVVRRAQSSDVVYLQGPVSEGLPGTLAALLVQKPTVMKIVGDYAWEISMQQTEQTSDGHVELLDEFLTRRHKGKIWWLEKIERWTAKRAKQIIVPSQYLKNVIVKWGISPDRITVVYNGMEPLNDGRSRDEARSAFGVMDKRVLLTVVRAVPWKGGDFIIRLLAELPADVLFVIAGDGPSLSFWKSEAERLNVADRVRFVGRLGRADLAEWYRAADLFVLATGYEGFSHVAVEAAMAGLPLYISDKRGNVETHAMFPHLVKLLAYQDRDAWLNALKGTWMPRQAPSVPPFDHPQMVAATMDVLKKAV